MRLYTNRNMAIFYWHHEFKEGTIFDDHILNSSTINIYALDNKFEKSWVDYQFFIFI